MSKKDRDRRTRGSEAALWVYNRIRASVPVGLGAWPPVGEMVAPEDAAFIAKLDEWIEQGGAHQLDAAMRAADELVAAWQRAGAAWQAAQ